jgi:predicted nucleotidyltransferase component of viral defense system
LQAILPEFGANMFESEQRLMAQILDLFAKEFDAHAVLRGGMVLQILGSARYTNDLDYVFIPYQSKKEIVPQIVNCLKKLHDVQISYSLNSKCLRVLIKKEDIQIQIEAKVDVEMKTAIQSTRLLTEKFQLPSRLIRVMDYEVALAHKLAAWNERRLIRDMYDVCFFLNMNVLPDKKTLKIRLDKPEYSKLVKTEDRFKGSDIGLFFDFIRTWAAGLREEQIDNELENYMEPSQMVGLQMQFRAALVKLNYRIL